MNIGVNMGHTLNGANSGAIGINNIREQDLTREVGKLVIQYLQKMGHIVHNCTVDSALSSTQALRSIVTKANDLPLDLFVSIHFNASGGVGHGTEIFTNNAIKLDSAERILKNISKLGYAIRGTGIKDGGNLYVIGHTKAKALLVECCFIDNKEDMAKYNADKMARAIAEGITGTKIPQDKPKEVINDKMYYRVVVGSFNSKNLAIQKQEELKKKGFDSFLLAYEK